MIQNVMITMFNLMLYDTKCDVYLLTCVVQHANKDIAYDGEKSQAFLWLFSPS